MNLERLKEIEGLSLRGGKHQKLSDGACVMEMVSYLADEPWSDHPQCACPILTAYAMRINDQFNDEHRQKLKPFIPLLINTKLTDEVQIARKRLIRWRNVTVTYPLILEVIKLPELAKILRNFENDIESMAAAAKFLLAEREKIKKTDAYAYTYAYTYTYADANAYTDADPHADADAYTDPDADAYAYAYVYAYTDVYTDAYTDANADADAWREKIATLALETLKLSIEIKE